jgi:Protein of unknown function (DUF3592)
VNRPHQNSVDAKAAALRARRENRSVIGLFLGVGLILVGLFGVVSSGVVFWRSYRIEQHGGRAEAQVLRKWKLRADDGDSDYLARYSFALPDGRRITTERGLNKSTWLLLPESTTFQVRYSVNDPEQNFPAGDGVMSNMSTIIFAMIFLVVASLGSLPISAYIRAGRDPDLPPGEPPTLFV